MRHSMNFVFLGLLMSFPVTYGMEVEPTQEGIQEANFRLLEAARTGMILDVGWLIKEGIADLNTKNSVQATPLIIASYHGHIWVAEELIKAGADVNSVDKYGRTALLNAVQNRSADLINALIKTGADINMDLNEYGALAFSWAVERKDRELLSALLKAGVDVNISDKCGYTAFILALEWYQLSISFALINPVAKYKVRKTFETLLMIYNKGCSCLSMLPREVLRIIITYAHPAFAMDRELIRHLPSHVLVDNIPVKTLSILIKDGTLNQDSILEAWQKKIDRIVQFLKNQKIIIRNQKADYQIEKFATDALKMIAVVLKFPEYFLKKYQYL